MTSDPTIQQRKTGITGLRQIPISIRNDDDDEGEGITALSSPAEFYQTLRKMILTAKECIVLSALYLGSGALEAELLTDLHQVLSDPTRPNLSIQLIFDHSRAQRGPRSSLQLLAPLIAQFPERIQVYLYQMPQLRRFPFSLLPGQLKEVAAVYHCKFCVCDQRVILTGANFAEEYFSTRQDRYWLIDESSLLPNSGEFGSVVSFLKEFMAIVRRDCHRLRKDGTVVERDDTHEGKRDLADQLIKLLSRHHTSESEQHDTDRLICIPLIQHKAHHIQIEEDCLLSILSSLPSSTNTESELAQPPISVKFSTPYTNFSSQLSEKILEMCYFQHPVEIIGPDQFSHGFASAKGFKALIPQFHLEAFVSAMKCAYSKISQKNPEISLISSSSQAQHAHYFYEQLQHFTFQKSGWTFHAKGFWFDLPTSSLNRRLSGTYIGSSNFGERSWNRDFELGFLFLNRSIQTSSASPTDSTKSWNFDEFLQKEYDVLRKHSVRDYSLNQRIASFSHHPPSQSSRYTPTSFLKNNLLNLENLKAALRHQMISLFVRFIKTYL